MSDFQDYRYPLHFQKMTISAAGAADQMDFGPVPPGHLWAITNIAILNDTNSTARVRMSIVGFGEDHHLADILSPGDQKVYNVNEVYYVPEGRSLRVRFIASTSLDVLHAYVSGFDVIQPKGAKHA